VSKKSFEENKNEKQQLGSVIAKNRKRKNLSLRQFAKLIDLPPSNLSYIEKGVNVPTADIYQKIISVLTPSKKDIYYMDHLFSTIRKCPPPDICYILMENNELVEKIRKLSNIKLTLEQLNSIDNLFSSFNNQL